jgi:hypothetical protein
MSNFLSTWVLASVVVFGGLTVCRYIQADQPADPEEIRIALSESDCVKADLGKWKDSGQVITTGMLKKISEKCQALKDQAAVFDASTSKESIHANGRP